MSGLASGTQCRRSGNDDGGNGIFAGDAAPERNVRPRLDEQEEENIDDEENGPPFCEATIDLQKPSDGSSYTLKIKVTTGEYEESSLYVEAILYPKGRSSGTTKPKEIGSLGANLLQPARGAFHEMADADSGELLEVATTFADANGYLCRNSNITGLNSSSSGLLHLSNISISSSEHQSDELELQMVHETLKYLHSNPATSFQGSAFASFMEKHGVQWNLAVIMTPTLGEQKKYSRLGFRQLGRNRDEYQTFFVTSSSYFGGGDGQFRLESVSDVEALDLYVPPPIVEAAGTDKELQDLIGGKIMMGKLSEEQVLGLVTEVRNLVSSRGANVQNAHALHCAACLNTKNVAVLEALIALGAEVNAKDNDGATALHRAAQRGTTEAVQYLLRVGADRTATNDKGQTPLQVLSVKSQSTADFMQVFGLVEVRRPSQVETALGRLDMAVALMQPSLRARLIDGWLSPRMMGMFQHAIGSILSAVEDDCDWDPDINIARSEYLPPDVLETHRNRFSDSFKMGWEALFQAIASLLDHNQAPTIQRVQERVGYRINAYRAGGGKISYALDALLSITRNGCFDGDDGWEFCFFEEDMEAHPEDYPPTPLDTDFELARIKCLGLGAGDTIPEHGPYRHNGRGRGGGMDEFDEEEQFDY